MHRRSVVNDGIDAIDRTLKRTEVTHISDYRLIDRFDRPIRKSVDESGIGTQTQCRDDVLPRFPVGSTDESYFHWLYTVLSVGYGDGLEAVLS